MNTVLHVGICIPSRKKKSIRLPERIRDDCLKVGIVLLEIDQEKSLEHQGPFDVVLHKILDYHNEFDFDTANKKIKSFMAYFARHPEIILVDNFKWCTMFTSRNCMIDLLKSCEFTHKDGVSVFLPKTLKISEAMTSADIIKAMHTRQMNFPVISKSYSAYFDDGSHKMSLLFSLASVIKLKTPSLIQEFLDHDGILYKVFVVGNKFNICERPSIKNMKSKFSMLQAPLHFDSHRVSKTGQPYLKEFHAYDPNARNWRSDDTSHNLLNRNVVGDLVHRIQQKTNLYLFGFDILVEKDTGNYAIIDINQFPSYVGINETTLNKNLVDLLKSFAK